MSLSNDLKNRLRIALASGKARDELAALLYGGNPFGKHWYVDGTISVSGDGLSPAQAFDTMAEALTKVDNDDTIHLRGPIFENCTAPTDKTGVTILGDGAGLRHGSTSNESEGKAPAWRTASGVTDEPLITLSTQGWTIADILFAPGSASNGIHLETESAATPEKTLSGTRILNCRFAQGKYAIEDDGGAGYITIAGNHFDGQTTASIVHTNGESLPLGWRILDNYFGGLSATHIDAPLVKSEIKGNSFGTVASTALYIDLTGGSDNVVTGNTLGGVYTTADYVAGTSDLWLGNWVTVISTQAPNGFTILAPAA